MDPPSIASSAAATTTSAPASTLVSALVQSILKAASENEGATLEQFLETGSIFQPDEPDDSRLGGTLSFGHVSGCKGKEWSKGSDSVVHSRDERTVYIGIDRQEVMRDVMNLEALCGRVDTGVHNAISKLETDGKSEKWNNFHQACGKVKATLDRDKSVKSDLKTPIWQDAYNRLGQGASVHISSLWETEFYKAVHKYQSAEISIVMGRTEEPRFRCVLCGFVPKKPCKVSEKEVEMLQFTGVDFDNKNLYEIV